MKIYGLGLLACSMIILVSCSRANTAKDSLPDYVSFSQLPANYSLDDAKADGCVVFEDLSLTSGETEWNEFLEMTRSGQAATIRIARNYSEEDSTINFIDLSFDGSIYSIAEKDGANKQYKYLNHYTSKAGADAAYSTIDCYILVNKRDVSFNELEWALASSNSNDGIDQYRIYINLISISWTNRV